MKTSVLFPKFELVLWLCVALQLIVVRTTLFTHTPGVAASRIGAIGRAAATIFADGAADAPTATGAAVSAAPAIAALLGAGAPCRRTSTATLSARRSHATPSLSTASVNA